MSAFFGIWHGPTGLKQIATRVNFRTQVLADELKKMKIVLKSHNTNYFDTLAIDCEASGFSSADFLLAEFHKVGINLRKIDENTVGLSMNETVNIADTVDIIEQFATL